MAGSQGQIEWIQITLAEKATAFHILLSKAGDHTAQNTPA